MGIFRRLQTVIKSNLNSLLDQAEDPEKRIAQTVSDMESEVKTARKELIRTMATAKRLEQKQTELDEETARWEEKASLAVRENDDELAREALRRKARSATDAATARRQAAAQYASVEDMKSTLERVERKIDDLRSRKSTLAAEIRRARTGPATTPGTAGDSARFGSSAFGELDRMADGIDQMDAEVEAAKILDDPHRSDVDARFRALEQDHEGGAIEDELAALKKRLDG